MLHSLDFEYNHLENSFLHLVCVSLDDKVYWLDDNSETDDFLAAMDSLKGEHIVCHSASLAEIPCCLTLGINVDDYKWRCTETLHKLLCIFKGQAAKATSLLTLLNLYNIRKIDVNDDAQLHKEKMRNIILSGNVAEHKQEIIEYCASDTSDLIDLYKAELEILKRMKSLYDKLDIAERRGSNRLAWTYFKRDLDKLSEMNIATAKMYMESFNVSKYYIENLSDERFELKLKSEMNKIVPGLYRLDKGTQDKNVLGEWIFDKYPEAEEFWDKGDRKIFKTDGGTYSFSKEALKEFCQGREGVEDLEKLRQLLKLLQAAGGIKKKGDKNWYYPNTYKDGTHCHANEFGAVTTRYGMKATNACVPSWSKALRSALTPATEDEVYFSLDYSAQEMWIIAQLSKDRKLLKVYSEEDVYMALALQMGLYNPPKDHPGAPSKQQQKEEWFIPYKPLRAKVKALNLGMNYGMVPKSFAQKNKVSLEEAEALFKQYSETFDYKTRYAEDVFAVVAKKKYGAPKSEFKCTVTGEYIAIGPEQILQRVELKDDEELKYWQFERERRRFANYPMQCLGAQITREAIKLCQKEGLHPFIPMHDEIYFKTTPDKLENDIQIATRCMKQAAENCILDKEYVRTYPIKIGEAEVIRYGETVIHDGAEETHKQLIEIFNQINKDEQGETYGFNIRKPTRRGAVLKRRLTKEDNCTKTRKQRLGSKLRRRNKESKSEKSVLDQFFE